MRSAPASINFAPMFAAAKNRSKYYFMERDPVGIGGATNFNPFTNADNSLKAMRAAPQGTLYAVSADVHVGRRRARPRRPTRCRSRVTNDGDAPLTITAVHDRGRRARRRQRDGRRLLDHQPELLGHRHRRRSRRAPRRCRTTRRRPPTSSSAPKPGGTCTVNVGFKPTRTNYTSVARLQFTSTGDDAMDRVLLAGKSTRDALATVGGDVPSMLLGLTLRRPRASARSCPTVARTYDTAMAATVTTTTGDAALSVVDADTVNPGKLTNTVGGDDVRAAAGAAGPRAPTPRSRTRRSPRSPARR